ncbi:MAG TPA: CBS domain-containing protein [Microbacteriaceae bacterium]
MIELEVVIDDFEHALASDDLVRVSALLTPLTPGQIIELLERLSITRRAIVFRLLSKERALAVFEGLDPTLQSDLFRGLLDEDVVALFAELDADDRVGLLEELPAGVAQRLLTCLSADERALTATILGYPQGSIGRRMSPEYVSVRPSLTAADAVRRIHDRGARAETVYTIPVVDSARTLVGVVSLRDVLLADPDARVADIANAPELASATDDAETAARRCADLKVLALPIVDHERRLVGILTIDDALQILEGRRV